MYRNIEHFWMLLYSAVPLMRVLCAQVFWLHKAFCRHKKPTVLAPPSHMCPADDQDDDDDGDDDGTSIFCRSALTKLLELACDMQMELFSFKRVFAALPISLDSMGTKSSVSKK